MLWTTEVFSRYLSTQTHANTLKLGKNKKKLSFPIAARNHVNRMCLAADIPLIESGTAGYLGQVTVIKKVEHEHPTLTPDPVH